MKLHSLKIACLAALAAIPLPNLAAQATSTWNNAGTTWNNGADWAGGIPNGSTAQASFSGSGTLPPIITLGANISLGGSSTSVQAQAGLYFNPVATGQTVTFDGGGVNSLTFSVAASHDYGIALVHANNVTLNADTNFGANLTEIYVDTGAVLTFATGRTVTLAGAPIDFAGSGITNLNGSFNAGSSAGAVTIDSGTVNWNVTPANFTYTGATSAAVFNVRGNTAVLNFKQSVTNAAAGIELSNTNFSNVIASVYGTANGVTISSDITVSTAGSGGLTANVITVGANDTSATAGSPTTVTFAGNYTTESTTNRTTKFFAAANNVAQFTGVIGGDKAGSLLQATGAGTIVFGGSTANTYNSGITMEVGAGGTATTLKLAKTSGVALTGNVQVDTGATLLLGGSNQTGAASNLTLAGGTLNAATFADAFGTLTLGLSSTLTLGSGATLVFANSSAATWTGTLTINGTIVNGSTLRFGTSSAGLTAPQLSDIVLTGYAGDTVSLDSNGFLQVNAVPEASTWALLACGFTALAAWRRSGAGLRPRSA